MEMVLVLTRLLPASSWSLALDAASGQWTLCQGIRGGKWWCIFRSRGIQNCEVHVTSEVQLHVGLICRCESAR